ncbi:glycosyltransferase family 4 protein [Lacinutrix algicola]|uniref:glycosyltransferase family 4 protein n=1 Tax=Lacinutrix algicola TaxID=342954 RepID=UPI0006E2C0B4|nr:glycosyltransferase family 4 protein [Lacinutrix algicola]
MKFLVITNAPTLKDENGYKAYAPYVREMDIWSNHVDYFKIISPTKYNQPLLTIPFKNQPSVVSIRGLNFSSVQSALISLVKLPIVIFKLFKGMFWADHIHLRCPGNIGLLGCIVQIFFPKTIKTAKYAGNWDPEAKQPLSYRFQKWILSNTFLTKNMQVLVYGDWKNQSKNIKPFFTATYRETEIEKVERRDYNTLLKFVFVGSLVVGKRPLLAIKIIENLKQKGYNVCLYLFGDGILKSELIQYVLEHKIEDIITIQGNQTKDVVKSAFKTAHFSILPSQSEGWPKAIAEAMFFGCIPVVTKISCVPFMLDYGKRGILIEAELELATESLIEAIENKEDLSIKSNAALQWSQHYTLDLFESELIKLLKP